MSTRARCSNCRSYFNKEDAFWQNALQRICSSRCLSEYMDRKRPKPRQVKERRAAKASAKQATSIPVAVRMEVRARDGVCRWCGRPGQQVHHIHYRSEGGPHEPSNLILLCTPCHSRVHTSKKAYQPLLLAYVWIRCVEGRALFIPEVAARLRGLGLLTDLQEERLAS